MNPTLTTAANAETASALAVEKISLTVFTGDEALGKSFYLDSEGRIARGPVGLNARSFEMKSFDVSTTAGAKELVRFYIHQRPNSFITMGVPTEARLSGAVKVSGASGSGLTRTGAEMEFVSGRPGLLLLDHDRPNRMPAELHLDQDGILEALEKAVPGISAAVCLQYASSSSFIQSPTEARGLRGHHTWIAVRDACDIPRAADALFKRLVLAGCGFADITQAGVVRIKTVFDATMNSPEKPVFSAPATLRVGLTYTEARKRALRVVGGELFDSRQIADLDQAEQARYDAIVAQLGAAAETEAQQLREEWRKARREALVASGMSEAKAEALLDEARERHKLHGDFPIEVNGLGTVTVREIRANRAKFHRKTARDPLEPEYNGGAYCATVFSDQEQPAINSHAHGERRSFLLVMDAEEAFAESLPDHGMPDAEQGRHAEPAKRERFRLLSVPELQGLPPQRWLIDQVLPERGLSLLVGEPGAGKTFVAIDFALQVASGKRWNDQDTLGGPVVYLAAEGVHGLAGRLDGWASANDVDISNLPLRLLQGTPDLTGDGDVKEVLELIARSGLGSLRLLVIDTLNRVFVGDENAAADMGKFIRNVERLAQELKCQVLIVHHRGKDAQRGARGHSSLKAAVDTEITLENYDRTAGTRIAQLTKQRDGRDSLCWQFTLKGSGVTPAVQVLSPVQHPSEVKRRTPTGKVQQAVLRYVMKMSEAQAAFGGEPHGVTYANLVEGVLKGLGRKASRSDKNSITRAIQALVEMNLLVDRKESGRISVPPDDYLDPD